MDKKIENQNMWSKEIKLKRKKFEKSNEINVLTFLIKFDEVKSPDVFERYEDIVESTVATGDLSFRYYLLRLQLHKTSHHQ